MRRLMTLALATTALAGCTYTGGDIGDPLTRKATWFSFVGGDDIRASCQPGTPDRYRLVYNAVYGEQLRVYETDSVRRTLSAKVVGPDNLTQVSVDDLLAPWRAKAATAPLSPADWQDLRDQLKQAGAFGPAAAGLELPSRSYFWTAATCQDGKFTFTGWRHPDQSFTQLAFPATLFRLDGTGVAVRPAAPIPFDPQYDQRARRGEVASFTLKVGTNGLVR